jgi:hypothetical protein
VTKSHFVQNSVISCDVNSFKLLVFKVLKKAGGQAFRRFFFRSYGMGPLFCLHTDFILTQKKSFKIFGRTAWSGSPCCKISTYTGQHNKQAHALSGVPSRDPSVPDGTPLKDDYLSQRTTSKMYNALPSCNSTNTEHRAVLRITICWRLEVRRNVFCSLKYSIKLSWQTS